MVDILALVLHHVMPEACLRHDEQAVRVAVEMALAQGVATKTHVLNLLHRLIDGKTIGGPDIHCPLLGHLQCPVRRRDSACSHAREGTPHRPLLCAVSQRRMSNAMMACKPGPPEAAMRHDPASGAIIMARAV